MYGLGAENNFVIDPESSAQWLATRENVSQAVLKQLAEKRRKERMMAWGIGLGVAAALGVGGWFVYTRYIQE